MPEPLTEQEIVRRQKLEQMRQAGIDPYPPRVERTHTAAAAIAAFAANELEEEETVTGRKSGGKEKAGGSTPASSTSQKEAADAALAAALGLPDAKALTDPRSALASIPKHVLSKLAAEQSAAVAANKETAAALRSKKASSDERKLHRVLRLLGGRAAGTNAQYPRTVRTTRPASALLNRSGFMAAAFERVLSMLLTL